MSIPPGYENVYITETVKEQARWDFQEGQRRKKEAASERNKRKKVRTLILGYIAVGAIIVAGMWDFMSSTF